VTGRHRIRYSTGDRLGFIVCAQTVLGTTRPVLSVDIDDAIEFGSREAAVAWLLKHLDARIVASPGELCVRAGADVRASVPGVGEPRAWVEEFEPRPDWVCSQCGSEGYGYHACQGPT